MSDIQLVIFDWVGTVIDFGACAPADAYLKAFHAKGVEALPNEIHTPMGLNTKDHIREMLKGVRLGQQWHAVYGRNWAEADVEEINRIVVPLQIEAAGTCRTLIPGVLECVAHLRKLGIQIGATTDYSREVAEVCYAAGREQGFVPDFTICADDVPAGRPAPWMIYRVMEALNVYPPTTVVKIGDTRIDIEDGVNAAAWSVGITDSSSEMGLSPKEFAALSEEDREQRREAIRETFFAAGADGAMDTLADLPELIVELNKILAETEE